MKVRGVILVLLFTFISSSFASYAATSISNCEELQKINTNLETDYYLTDNIDCSATINWGSVGFNPLGYPSRKFSGNFDGKGYVISDLFINRTGSEGFGLFGETDSAKISNVGVINAKVVGGNFNGILIGIARNTTVYRVYTTGYVNSSIDAGGLIGKSLISTINQSYSIASIESYTHAGGLVSELINSTIIDSYSRSDIKGKSSVGGLAGSATSTNIVKNSYASSNTSGVTSVGAIIGYSENSYIIKVYFNLLASNKTAAVGSGTIKEDQSNGISDDNMKRDTLFVSSGWNFSSIWQIDSSINNGYPFLRWQTEKPITDLDEDKILDKSDNCQTIPNPTQENNDQDKLGDACDNDDDNDNVADTLDNCQFISNLNQNDLDKDKLGDACDNDDDNDGVNDDIDNCKSIENPDQKNFDLDSEGTLCDADDDNDNVLDEEIDVCAETPKSGVVNSQGCTVSQAIPRECFNSRSNNEYVLCAIQIAQNYKNIGLISQSQYEDAIKIAKNKDIEQIPEKIEEKQATSDQEQQTQPANLLIMFLLAVIFVSIIYFLFRLKERQY